MNEGDLDPSTIDEMEIKEQAVWLGKWFGLQFLAWVSKFSMRDLETYDGDSQIGQDVLVGPVPSLWWTFTRFQVSEDVWRSPSFHVPV